MPVKDLTTYFPDRNTGTLTAKALSLQLVSPKIWKPRENLILYNILYKYFFTSHPTKLTQMLPHRSWLAIRAQGERLGLTRNRHQPRIRVNEAYFDFWTANSAYMLGFIVSDGCIIKGTYKGYSDALKFGVQLRDMDILQKIKRELGSEHAISIYKNAAHFCITSQKLVDRLKTYGVTYRKSLKEKVPPVPAVYISDFIRGVVDGDGGISYDKRNHPTLRIYGSEDMINFIGNYLYNRLKAYSSVHKLKYSRTLKLYLYNVTYRSNTAKKVISHLYNNATLYLNRKYDLAMHCKSITIKKYNRLTKFPSHYL
jgi:hypothetical protein